MKEASSIANPLHCAFTAVVFPAVRSNEVADIVCGIDAPCHNPK